MSLNTQFDNLGDALINRELARLLATDASVIIDYSRCPSAFRKTLGLDGAEGIQALQPPGLARLLRHMVWARLLGRKCYFFLNPGGLGRAQLVGRQVRSAAAYNLVLRFLGRIGVKVCLVGVSYDPLNSENLRLLKSRAASVHCLAVRDKSSLDYLYANGCSDAVLIPDLSFNLYQNGPLKRNDDRSVGFSFRFDGVLISQLESLVDSVTQQFDKNTKYCFVSQVTRDEQPMKTLEKRIRKRGFRTEFYSSHNDIDAMIEYYRGCCFVYSNRLHVLLLGAYAGSVPVPVVNRALDRKICALFDDIGEGARVVDLGDVATAKLRPEPIPVATLRGEFTKLKAAFHALLTCGRKDGA